MKLRDKLSWWESKPLFGWKVLVPRTKEQAAALSEQLSSYGAIPVEVPTIAVEPPRTPQAVDRAIRGLVSGRYAWLALTSVNAVKAIREKIEELGLDSRALAGVKIACVGEQTAAAMIAWGIRPELVPSGDQSSEGLLADWPEYEPGYDALDRVLLPRADIATETLSAGLLERGWQIDDVTAYRTVRAAPPPAETREAIKTGGFDAVLFTSSSTVRNLVGIAGKPHASSIIAVIGPQTAKTAEELGLRVDVHGGLAVGRALAEGLAAFGRDRRDERRALAARQGQPRQGGREVEAARSDATGGGSPRRGPDGCAAPPALRRLVAQVSVSPSDLVLPLFVKEGIDEPIPIAVDARRCPAHPGLGAEGRRGSGEAGVGGLILFGIPAVKDARGSGADDPDGIVQLALRDLVADVGDQWSS